MELTPGGMLGRYRLLERAGAGGMAEVWKAVQPSLDRFVAIKVLPRHLASQPGYLERFQREARAISRLDHPNILSIFDFGEDDGYTYMVTPFLNGGTLSRSLGTPWAVPAVVRVLEPIAAALDYAHGLGIVHRDVKPANILIGDRGRLVLSDFGVARMTEATLALSAAGALIGTPAYMSPEQVNGSLASPASDQYSLGIVAYEMLTGRRPFHAETPMAVALAHVHRPLPPPRSIAPSIPHAAEMVLYRALAKRAADRYPSVSAFVTSLAASNRESLVASANELTTTSTTPAPLPVESAPTRPCPVQAGTQLPQPVEPDRAVRAAPAVAPRGAPRTVVRERVPTAGSIFFTVLVGIVIIVMSYAVVAAVGFGLLPVAPRAFSGEATHAGKPVETRVPSTASPTSTFWTQVARTPGGSAGLLSAPSSAGHIVKRLPDGSWVELLGPEQWYGGRFWRHVRDDAGVTGWIADEWLAEHPR